MMAMPREGHLEQLFHMFEYNSSMVVDTIDPDTDDSQFVRADCSASDYSECKEKLPPNDPQQKVIGFTMK